MMGMMICGKTNKWRGGFQVKLSHSRRNMRRKIWIWMEMWVKMEMRTTLMKRRKTITTFGGKFVNGDETNEDE